MVEFVIARRDEGIRTFQLKVGNDPREDAQRVAAVLAEADDCLLIADANGGWSLQDAVVAADAMMGMPIYLEQPCLTLADCAAVRQVTRLPLVLDECILRGEDLVEAKRRAAAGSVNLKVGRLGGLSPTRLMRDLAAQLRISVTLEDTWGGDIATAAAAHLAASTAADQLLSVSFFNDWNVEHIATSYPRSSNGRGAAPSVPGLGVEVDLAALGEPLFRTH
jgi:L-alanine-DL-glutamate epimerase-like enolase superfamily enzyme